VYIPSARAQRKILDLCTTFLLDVSVLVFVFPILDAIVEHGEKGLTFRLFVFTLTFSGVFFVLAVAAAIVMTSKEENDPA